MKISEDLKLLKREVHNFIKNEVEPLSRWIDENDSIPVELVSISKEIGLFGLTIPEEYGGIGLNTEGKCLIEEELGRSNYGYATLIGNHTGISSTGIAEMGNQEQKKKYLPRMATGEWIASFALTEPQAGSDAANLRTTAENKGDKWILNGEKIFITNAPHAHVFTVMAVTDKYKGAKGISAFIVERDFPGIKVGPNEKKMGMHGAHTAPVIFEDCEVPEENLLGTEGMGYISALQTLTKGRVTLSARCLGMMERLLEMSVEYSKNRIQFGKPICENQGIQWMLSDMGMELDAARLLTYRAAEILDRGGKGTKEAAIAKLFTTEALAKAADNAVQIHGGMGYVKEFDVERFYRDARITRIYEGTSEIQRMIIAKQLLK